NIPEPLTSIRAIQRAWHPDIGSGSAITSRTANLDARKTLQGSLPECCHYQGTPAFTNLPITGESWLAVEKLVPATRSPLVQCSRQQFRCLTFEFRERA